jgi:hypothetical protein
MYIIMVEIAKTFFELLEPKFLVQNIYLFSILSIFLVVYGPRLHIRLPSTLRHLFDNTFFRMLVLFLIAYMAHRNFVVALTIAIIFIVTMNILHTTNAFESLRNSLFQENFVTYGPPVADCNTYDKNKREELRTSFYPLNPVDSDLIGNEERELADIKFANNKNDYSLDEIDPNLMPKK